MPQLFTNNASGTLASAVTAVATTMALTAGHGARFPAISGGDYFLLTLYEMSGTQEVNHEVVKVTGRATDTLTVVRAQEGTTSRAWGANAPVELRITAGAMSNLMDKDSAQAVTGRKVFSSVAEKHVAMAANAIDLAQGNFFSKTISGATTLTVSNVPASGDVVSFIMELTNGGAGTITWPAGTKWAGGAAPALTASGIDVLGFYTRDGGTTWRAMLLSKDSK